MIIDSGLESTKIVSYVATNNYHGGVLAAQRLGELLKGEGKIILLRYAVGSASTEEREKGFTDTIAKEFPKITYLSDTEYAGATSDTAQQKAQNLVTRYPRAGRRDLLPERVEHVRDAPGAGRGRDAGGAAMSDAVARDARRRQVVRREPGARRGLARPRGGRGPRPDRRERRGQEHADEGPQRRAIGPTRAR